MVVLHYGDGRRDQERGGDDKHGEAAALPAGQVKSEAAAAAEPEDMTLERLVVATTGLRTFLGAVGLIMLRKRYGEEQTWKEEANEESEKRKVQCLRKNVKEDVDEVT
ncbi:unnamed protein product [Urochloa humidicola]